MEKNLSSAMYLMMGLFVVSVSTVTLFSRPGSIYAADSNDVVASQQVSDNEDNGIDRAQASDL